MSAASNAHIGQHNSGRVPAARPMLVAERGVGILVSAMHPQVIERRHRHLMLRSFIQYADDKGPVLPEDCR